MGFCYGIIIENGIILRIVVILPIILVGGIPTPLKNMRSSIGVTIPNTWKVIKFMFQTTNQMKTTLTHYSKDSEKLPFTIISYMFVSFRLLFHTEKARRWSWPPAEKLLSRSHPTETKERMHRKKIPRAMAWNFPWNISSDLHGIISRVNPLIIGVN